MDIVADSELQAVDGRNILQQVTAPVNPVNWATQRKDRIKNILHTEGALVIRGLRFHSTRQFGQFLEELFEQNLAEYKYRSTPRTTVGNNVYTATEYHPSVTIPQHNESSYSNAWAMRIGFFCMTPPAPGMGATPLADSRQVLARIPRDVIERFENKKLQYVRNYGSIDLPWSEVFQTDSRKEVELFCADHGISTEWIGTDGLRTKQVTPAVETHPVTGERVWFNQAHLFHISGLSEDVARDLKSIYREEDLPRNVYFGDGSAIPSEDLDAIRTAYDEVKFHFDWQKNDIVLLDNMLYTHGRQPYTGERKILVGMAATYQREALK